MTAAAEWALRGLAAYAAAALVYAEWQIATGSFAGFRKAHPALCGSRVNHYLTVLALWPVLAAIDLYAIAVAWWHGGWRGLRDFLRSCADDEEPPS